MRKPAIAGLLLFLLLAVFPITNVLAEETPPPEASSEQPAAPTLPPEEGVPVVTSEPPLPTDSLPPAATETPLPAALPAETPLPADTPEPVESPAATPEISQLLAEFPELFASAAPMSQGPDYIITVPQAVDFGKLVPLSGEKTITFKLQVEAANLMQGRLDICAAPPDGAGFTLQNGSGFAVPYTVTCGAESLDSSGTLISILAPDAGDIDSPGTPSSLFFDNATPSGLFAAPPGPLSEMPEPVDMSLEVQLSIDTDAITQSGSYTGTMVFLVGYVPVG